MLPSKVTRTYAMTTPKPCQDWKVAAIRDACDRRGLRVFTTSDTYEEIAD